MDFVAFPKIPRLSREVVITEKLDGTNASVHIYKDTTTDWLTEVLRIKAGSRNRWITPEDDNYGFAKWVEANKEELMKLGEGTHYGEWWGQGIQRGYDLKEKRFSLFNTGRWNKDNVPSCCHVVPVLHQGIFSTDKAAETIMELRDFGSAASIGFKKPEGIMIYHTAAGQYFKKTIENDEKGKSE